MQKIITATGKEFVVMWCGLSTVDNVLRFEVKGKTMQEVLETFTNGDETSVITHVFDELVKTYINYTVFSGVDMRQTGSIVVSLMEESA